MRKIGKLNLRCHSMFDASTKLLQRQAWYLMHNKKPEQAEKVVFCILVDSCWNSLVQILMPNQNKSWNRIRNDGLEPIAIGITDWSELEPAVQLLPAFAQARETKPTEGMVKVVVLSDQGGSIGEIMPKIPEGLN